MNKLSLILLCTIFGLSLNATTFISSMNGNYNNPLTWGGILGGPVPGINDTVIVAHNVSITATRSSKDLTILSGASVILTTGSFNAYGTFTLSTGGVLDIGAKVFRARAAAIINGNVNGTSGRFYFISAGNLSGTGNFNNTGRVYLSRTMDILAGSNITKTVGEISQGSVVVSNYGIVNVVDYKPISGSTWINKANSSFTISGAILTTTMTFNASATGNTVTYGRFGTGTQDIITPVLGRYYNLTIDGDDVTSKKRLTGNINILGELNINGSTLKAGISSSYDIDIKGNWYNNGGVFEPMQGFVSFNGSSDQELDNGDFLESFYDVYFLGDGILSLFADLDVARNITIDKVMDTFGQAINVGGSWTAPDNFDLQGSVITFDENSSGTITGDIAFENLTIDKTLTTSTITIAATTTVSVTGSVDVLQGILNTNGNLVIISNPSGTGRIGDLSNGTINGDVEVQRFFDDATNGWHLMCSPVQGATLEDWDDDVITTGFTGSDYPTFEFNNATYYDEVAAGADRDAGLINATNSTQSISTLNGWRMYLAAGATTIDVKGPIFSGTQTIPVSYNGDAAPLEDGWNLISNPYVSTINWDDTSSYSRSGLHNAIYVWDPSIEQYTSYVDSVGTNGGTPYIPSTQAFWVQAFEAPSISIDETAKVTNDTEFKNNNSQNTFFKITVSNEQGLKSDVAVRIDRRATDGFDGNFDAYYLESSNTSIPAISILDEDDLAYSIYSIGEISEERIIPLNVRVGASQNIEFTFGNLDSFKKASCLSFVDMESGVETPITSETSIDMLLEAGTYADRFFIKLIAPVHASVINEQCATGEDKIQVELPIGTSWNVIGYDENNTVVFNQNSEGGIMESEFLPAGNYALEIISQNGNCANTNDEVYIPHHNTPDITFETIAATYGSSDGTVNTIVTGALPPYQYSWSDGSTNASLENVMADTYGLTVTDSRDCSYSTNVILEVKGGSPVVEDRSLEDNAITMVQLNNEINVSFDLESKQNFSINVYNSIGQMIFEDEINGVQVDRVSVPSGAFQGVVLIVLQNQETNEKIVQRFVM